LLRDCGIFLEKECVLASRVGQSKPPLVRIAYSKQKLSADRYK